MNLEQITEIEIIDLICHSDRKDKADTIIYMSSLYHYYHYEIKMAKTKNTVSTHKPLNLSPNQKIGQFAQSKLGDFNA